MEITINGKVVRYYNESLLKHKCQYCVKKYQCTYHKSNSDRACFMLRSIYLDYVVFYNLSEIASHHFIRGKVCDKEFLHANYQH